MQSRRLSTEAAAVLKLFLDDRDLETFGREIIRETGIASGSLYPILRRFEGEGYLISDWEPMVIAEENGRRPRRKYRLNPAGVSAAELAFKRRARVPSGARTSVRRGPATV